MCTRNVGKVGIKQKQTTVAKTTKTVKYVAEFNNSNWWVFQVLPKQWALLSSVRSRILSKFCKENEILRKMWVRVSLVPQRKLPDQVRANFFHGLSCGLRLHFLFFLS